MWHRPVHRDMHDQMFKMKWASQTGVQNKSKFVKILVELPLSTKPRLTLVNALG